MDNSENNARGGIRRGDVAVGVTVFPGNKRPGIYVTDKYVCHKVASIADEGDARLFLDALNYLAFGGAAVGKAEEE